VRVDYNRRVSGSCRGRGANRVESRQTPSPKIETQSEVDALGVITISRGCFERCCSNKNSPIPF